MKHDLSEAKCFEDFALGLFEIAKALHCVEKIAVSATQEAVQQAPRLIDLAACLAVQREYELHLCEAAVASQDAAG